MHEADTRKLIADTLAHCNVPDPNQAAASVFMERLVREGIAAGRSDTPAALVAALLTEYDRRGAEIDRLRARETALVEALAEAGRALDEVERRVTLGGRAPAVDRSWANLALPAPASAGVAGAPPLHRRTRDEV